MTRKPFDASDCTPSLREASATILSHGTLTSKRLGETHCPAATWSNATKLCSCTTVGADSSREAPAAIVKVQPFDWFFSVIDVAWFWHDTGDFRKSQNQMDRKTGG